MKPACQLHGLVHSPASTAAARHANNFPLLTSTLADDGGDTTEGSSASSAQCFLSVIAACGNTLCYSLLQVPCKSCSYILSVSSCISAVPQRQLPPDFCCYPISFAESSAVLGYSSYFPLGLSERQLPRLHSTLTDI